MKKITVLNVSLLFVFLICLGVAPVAAEEKIGFYDMDQVIRNSEAGKKSIGEIQRIVDKNRPAIQAKEEELQKLKDELEKQRSLMKPDVLKDKEVTYQKKFRDYQILIKDSNEELQAKQQDMVKDFVPEIMKIVKNIGEREKYTLIIDVYTVPVAHWSKAHDLTKKVLDEFNRTFKAGK
ncbi:MAG: OmpH family outer membrane protein [Syntrophales bacterium]|jgi:outer membrane protein|nr:OmpH family outer membrane protein [Syntrophales bacterium]NLN59973.1 OmpH family outer membrane protein [Deltaproteobacteria bacterium]